MQDFGTTTTASSGTAVFLHPTQIICTTPAKSTAKSKNAIIRLASSIQKYGIIEPLCVKAAQQGNHLEQPRYELIDGERRLKAATLAGISSIPCLVLPENHRICATSTIIKQLRQESLNFFEQAAAFRMLITDFSLTQEEIAQKSGLSQSAVANKLRLLTLTKEEQGQILALRLTERHARALLRIENPEARKEAILRIKRGNLNVSKTEELIDELLVDASAPPKASEEVAPRKFALQSLTPFYNSIERSLTIFRKTGAAAFCHYQEAQDGVHIVIDIPKNGG